MAKNWKKFKKGDLILTDLGFPAFVWENQTSKDYISVYAFGIYDEHGSERPWLAKKVNTEKWFKLCQIRGYSRDYVITKAKGFKVNI